VPDLEFVEKPGFRHLNFSREPLDEILIDDAVRRGKKSQDVGDEVPLI